MTRALATTVLVIAWIGCSRANKVPIRREVVAMLAARSPRIVPPATPECIAGSAMKGIPRCALSDPDRWERREKIRFQFRMIISQVAIVGNTVRDELAARIVRDPGFFDALVDALGREYSCAHCDHHDQAVIALDSELANMFARCLQLAIAGDDAMPGGAPQNECEALVQLSSLDNLSDDDLTGCFANNVGRLHVREDIMSFLASYHSTAQP